MTVVVPGGGLPGGVFGGGWVSFVSGVWPGGPWYAKGGTFLGTTPGRTADQKNVPGVATCRGPTPCRRSRSSTRTDSPGHLPPPVTAAHRDEIRPRVHITTRPERALAHRPGSVPSLRSAHCVGYSVDRKRVSLFPADSTASVYIGIGGTLVALAVLSLGRLFFLTMAWILPPVFVVVVR